MYNDTHHKYVTKIHKLFSQTQYNILHKINNFIKNSKPFPPFIYIHNVSLHLPVHSEVVILAVQLGQQLDEVVAATSGDIRSVLNRAGK